jgi:hypothetical protein
MRGYGTNFLLVSQHIIGSERRSARVYRHAKRGARYGVAICLDGIHGDSDFNGWELEGLLAVYDSVVCIRGSGSEFYRDVNTNRSGTIQSLFVEQELPDFLESVGIADPIIAIYGVSLSADTAITLACSVSTVTDVFCVSGYYWWHLPCVRKRLQGMGGPSASPAEAQTVQRSSPAKLVGSSTKFTVHFVAGLGMSGSKCSHSRRIDRIACFLWELLSLCLTLLIVLRCLWTRQRFTLLLIIRQRHCWGSWRGVGKQLHSGTLGRRLRMELGSVAR